jgi:hypothetical protein
MKSNWSMSNSVASRGDFRSRVQILSGTWADAITELRLAAYQSFGENIKDPSGIRWGATDSWSLNLGVIEDQPDDLGEKLLSVLRLEKHLVKSSLEFSLQAKVAQTTFPAAVLSRAATHAEAADEGLHMLLRFYVLKALINADVGQVYGTFKARSRRSQFLETLGYKMTKQGASWSDFLQTDEPTDLAVLDLRSDGASALRRLTDEINRRPETIAAKIFQKMTSQNENLLLVEIVAFLKT